MKTVFAKKWISNLFKKARPEMTVAKAINYVRRSYCDRHIGTPYLLIGDVAELIKITTGVDVDISELIKYEM